MFATGQLLVFILLKYALHNVVRNVQCWQVSHL